MSLLARFVRRLLLIAATLLVLGGLWTGYKAMGQATGDQWPLTNRDLPVQTDNETMPPAIDIVTRFFQDEGSASSTMLLTTLIGNCLFTLREAAVGFAAGFVIGMGLAIVMLRWRLAERGLLPYVIASQTVPLIALVPVIVAWGSQIDLGFMTWEPWMSVALVATYLTFFPVAVNGLRGLQSPSRQSIELMESYAAPWRVTLVKLRLPSSLPYLVPALRLAAAASIVGAIVGEISAGVRGGLGRAILDSAIYYLSDPPRLYACVLTAAFLGLTFVSLVGLVDTFTAKRRPPEVPA